MNIRLLISISVQYLGTRAGSVRMVKVRWSENEKDVTWELEEKIRDLQPELFSLSVLCMSRRVSSGSGVSVIPYH